MGEKHMWKPLRPMTWDEAEKITSIAEEDFILLDRYFDSGIITLKIDPEIPTLKVAFEDFADKMKEMGYIPQLKEEGEYFLIRIINRPKSKASSKIKFLALLLATLTTVFIDGYVWNTSPLLQGLNPFFSPLRQAVIFTLALLGIIGLHELGHIIALSLNRVESSPPYFIPGIPGIPGALPTFGAVIMQKEIPTNRDRLFDLGIAGPIFGLIATIAVTIFAVLNRPIVTQQYLIEFQRISGETLQFFEMPVPLLYVLIRDLVRPLALDEIPTLDPLQWVAVVGMLLTFLNTLPAWQLDGGHMSRAILGPRLHSLATMASILFMAVIGFLPMALFVLFLWMISGGREVAPLDDYSSASKERKILFIFVLFIAFLCAPLPFI